MREIAASPADTQPLGLRGISLLPHVTADVLLASAPPRRAPGPMRFSLGNAPSRERPWMLQQCFARLGFTYDVTPLSDVPIEADVVLHALPGLRIAAGRLGGATHRRVRALVEDGTEDYGLLINMRGSYRIAQGKDDLVLDDGEAVLVSCSHPNTLAHQPPGDVITLRVPRAQLAPLVNGVEDHTLRRIPRGTAALSLLTSYIELAWAGPRARDVQHLMAAHVHDLMALTLGATRDAAHTARGGGLRAARFHAIKQDIAKSLAQPDLSVLTLAKRHACTPRFVQRLFEAEGTTFTEYVLAQRLARAHRLLSDPRREGEKISAVAYDAGFGDVSYFNRAFRRHFGAAPSEIRAQALRAVPDRLM
jgi:AraC-like DNA-binding protein